MCQMITKPLRKPMSAMVIVAPLLFAMPAVAATQPGGAPAAKPAAHHHHAARHRRMAAATPIQPIAPQNRPSPTDTAAPVPNQAVTPPVDNSDQHTSVAPAVMQIHYPPMGDGYTNGSSAQAMDDREAAKVTGVQVHVPLGQ
jgi:hypothetical protein